MGLLDMIRPGGNDEDRGQWSDVPIGFRLGLLGNIIANAANGGGQGNMAGFAAMANMTQEKVESRKEAKKLQRQNELAAKYLEKRPDLKPLVEAGVISVGDIIKMDREDQKTADDRKYGQENWLFQQDYLDKKGDEDRAEAARIAAETDKTKRQLEWEDWFKKRGIEEEAAKELAKEKAAQEAQAAEAKRLADIEDFKIKERFKMENDPDRNWWQQFSGQGPAVPQATPMPVATPQSTPIPGAPGVPTPPASVAPGPTPVPDGQANDPVAENIKRQLNDPNLTPQEISIIKATVRNPDDLSKVYADIQRNRTEQAKVKAEQDKLTLEKSEAAKKEAAQKSSGQASMTTAVTAIDQAINAIDAPGLPAAGMGAALKFFPQTNAYQASEAIETLKSYISIEKLAEMRVNSTSGASGLGQVTNYEQRMLAASQGTIAQGLDPELLRNNLKNVRAKIVAFNTPSAEDPSISQMEMDARKLAAAKTDPKVIEAFEAKYGVGSSSAITGDTTPAADREPIADDEVDVGPDVTDILKLYPQTGGN